MCMCELPTDNRILTPLHLSVFLIHVYAENLRVFLRKRDACANSVYQALSPPLRSLAGPEDEAIAGYDIACSCR